MKMTYWLTLNLQEVYHVYFVLFWVFCEIIGLILNVLTSISKQVNDEDYGNRLEAYGTSLHRLGLEHKHLNHCS